MTGRLRVACVDDDTVIRNGLPLLLPALDFGETYADVDALLTARPDVDVVVLDLVLTGTGRAGVRQGPSGVQAVARAGYRVVIYTGERRTQVLTVCVAAGASGVVHKAEPISTLQDAIERVAAGEIVITQALVGLAELVERRGGLPSLSARQREVLSARARGEPFKSIAKRLYITVGVADEHMAAVNLKFKDYLSNHSAADLERELGFAPGDLLDWRGPDAG
jgi:DNA-binding NarL/FixJ family response regulator